MESDKYNQLKEVIQKANPEIMELKFGCEVYCEQIIEDESGTLVDLHGIFVEKVEDECQILLEAEGCSGLWPYNQPDVLGRPIRLADVLLAMGDDKRLFHTLTDADRIIMRWKLRDDNLDHQSEQCKAFLYNLLVNNN